VFSCPRRGPRAFHIVEVPGCKELAPFAMNRLYKKGSDIIDEARQSLRATQHVMVADGIACPKTTPAIAACHQAIDVVGDFWLCHRPRVVLVHCRRGAAAAATSTKGRPSTNFELNFPFLSIPHSALSSGTAGHHFTGPRALAR
jgi:hypothetical protein